MMKHILILSVILSLGFTVVYAETSTIQVPFDYHGMTCWYDEEAIEYHCTWQGGERDPFTVEDLEKFKDILSDEVYQEELAKLTGEPIVVEPKLTPNERIIQELEKKLNNGEADAKDSVLYHLLTQLDTCQQGMDTRTAPIQTAREFEISTFKQWSMNNVPYEGQIGILVKAVEECEAQQVLAYNVLGAGYMNMPTGDDDVQYSLLEEYKGIQALDYELYTKNSKRIDMNGICDNNQYTWSNKIMMGCEDTRVFDGTTHKGTSGKIQYFSQLIGEYNQYLNENSRYATVEDKAIQAIIAEPIAKNMIESNHFWKNQNE